MTNTLFTHATASPVFTNGDTLPTNLQWMPPGRQSVQPMGFDEPFEMLVTPAIAAAADRQLQEMLSAAATGSDVPPYIDINHEDRVRAFLPEKITWGGDDPKSGGVRVSGRWTGGGERAVRDGEQCVISPSWMLDKLTKAFLGIRHNLGGLVTRSAFNTIQAFAKAANTSIADLDLKAIIRRLNQTYGVKVTLDSVSPLMVAADQLAQRNATGYMLELNRLALLEPELQRYQKFLETGIDPLANKELWKEVQVLQSEANKKAEAEAQLAAAKAIQARTGTSFVDAWQMAKNEISAAAHAPEQRESNAMYLRAKELQHREGSTFEAAHARAKVEHHTKTATWE